MDRRIRGAASAAEVAAAIRWRWGAGGGTTKAVTMSLERLEHPQRCGGGARTGDSGEGGDGEGGGGDGEVHDG